VKIQHSFGTTKKKREGEIERGEEGGRRGIRKKRVDGYEGEDAFDSRQQQDLFFIIFLFLSFLVFFCCVSFLFILFCLFFGFHKKFLFDFLH